MLSNDRTIIDLKFYSPPLTKVINWWKTKISVNVGNPEVIFQISGCEFEIYDLNTTSQIQKIWVIVCGKSRGSPQLTDKHTSLTWISAMTMGLCEALEVFCRICNCSISFWCSLLTSTNLIPPGPDTSHFVTSWKEMSTVDKTLKADTSNQVNRQILTCEIWAGSKNSQVGWGQDRAWKSRNLRRTSNVCLLLGFCEKPATKYTSDY